MYAQDGVGFADVSAFLQETKKLQKIVFYDF